MSNDRRPSRLDAALALGLPVTSVRLVSPARAKALKGIGIETIRDLVCNYPRRYIDLSAVSTIRNAAIGQHCTIMASVHAIKLKTPKARLKLVEMTLVDGTGTMIATFFQQPWLARQYAEGDTVTIAGKVEFDYGYKRMANPQIEKHQSEQEPLTGSIIPVHPSCEAIGPALMRRLIANALDDLGGLPDPLPLELRTRYRLMSRANALRAIHFPVSLQEAKAAKRRLIYEEVFLLELALMQEDARREAQYPGFAHLVDGAHLSAYRAHLPFCLTSDQEEAVEAILSGMAAPKRMNHLLLGDVGTGKTAVAGAAIAAACDNGTQAVLMAPTETLAVQHARVLGPQLDALGIRWGLLTGSSTAAQRTEIGDGLASGSMQVAIGTHALLENTVQFAHCTLVIIDEQQRFGVEQRAALVAKSPNADTLYLTATPIPRSLALAVYGNLTLSYLRKRPTAGSGRTTKVLDRANKDIAYAAATAALERGEQAYVVCPLIGTSAATAETGRGAKDTRGEAPNEERYEYAAISIESDGDYGQADLTAAEKEYEFLRTKTFSAYRVGLLHGRLSAAEKAEVMEKFRTGEIDVLVATTVIEVGIDVPNATVMLIQDADRFGLSQLHQLRGRVGRGAKPGEVFLISASSAPTALERLRAMESTDDGFELAAYDLSVRREGDILGNRQHGMSSLKLVNVTRDEKTIVTAHDDARVLMRDDPLLVEECHGALAYELRKVFKSDTVKQGG